MGYLSCQAPCHDDIAALVALDQRTLGGLWSAEGYERELNSPNSCLLMLLHKPHSIQGDQADLSTASMAALQTASDAEDAEPQPGPALGLDHRDEPTLLGLGCYWAILDEAHITVLAVDPRYQRRGLGKWLLVNLLADACDRQEPAPEGGDRALTRATLEVRPSNSRALALYESFGFEILGRRRRYYADGEDALILWQNSLKTAEYRDQLQQQRSAVSERLERQGWQIANKKLPLNRT
ncbi:GNAT family N-acetyltransferase [Phormidium sp. FACHB-322]|uniref:GNAT family N-acetyltransferase n=1 Tax=unclassified Phormidium TaxID=2609805 RepID=UPI001689ED40|nr:MULTISPECIES: GNAT family N-acetyltransferase [unclassified Phormidium]MBD1918682.1 GNAT family N-acetyltransferase [Phormidium sp. FACHB-77]MBD2029111.1 GNAT family N-acetyltransferase [Phormidium sp. FACHB-322]MBD2051301.1 GNAT family N-acetyltransferase [Leptolyngbya sp. FACHB-60]